MHEDHGHRGSTWQSAVPLLFTFSLHLWGCSMACEVSRDCPRGRHQQAEAEDLGPALPTPSLVLFPSICLSTSSDDLRSCLLCPEWARSFQPSFSGPKIGPS